MGIIQNIGNIRNLRDVRNIFAGASTGKRNLPGTKGANQNLGSTVIPIALQRYRQNTAMWRAAMEEAERAYFPYRVRMQQIYIDTILNGHVYSAMERRKDLTRLRKFWLIDDKGIENIEWTLYFQKAKWFKTYLNHTLDALFFGYSLIALGAIENNSFPNIDIIKRWVIRPDNLTVGQFPYQPGGELFLEGPPADWHIWVPTPTETGASTCGYGLFYKIGYYEILMRNMLGQNADFIETYGQPYRWGKTTKTEGPERDTMEKAISEMGAQGWAITDPSDEIEFLETALAGTGWKSYDNFEGRLSKVISKLVLGHEDAMSGSKGKLTKDDDESPQQKAMQDKQANDADFIIPLTNESLLPKMRKLGFLIPDNLRFEFKNDDEEQETRERKDKADQATALVMKTVSDAGGQPDWKYFSDVTGQNVTAAPLPPPPVINKPLNEKPPLDNKVQNRLNELYKNKK